MLMNHYPRCIHILITAVEAIQIYIRFLEAADWITIDKRMRNDSMREFQMLSLITQPRT